ncbi:unnamed protein product [Albugo candida]|uniref:Uncharacterized protein n=2 Tax=Albugo candida TaxID=65357 RepID=A0A024FXS4_9STRA|nr:unnamed protein product [Albugo candida]|eukprot:CCI39359.1 unnamed protein product [Albugo candida]
MNPVIIALQDRAQACIDSFLLDDAIFFAERLVSYRPSEENLYTLATCYHRVGDLNNAIAILQGVKNVKSRFMLALCYFQQNKTNEAADALTGPAGSDKGEVYGDNVINGAAGFNLMGKICRQNNQRDRAIKYFVESLELDPFLWSSYQNLCELGANMEALDFYGQRSYFDADRSIIDGISSSMMTPKKLCRQTTSRSRASSTPTSQNVNTSQPSSLRTPRGILSTRTPSAVKKKARIASNYAQSTPSTYRKPNDNADMTEKLPRRARLSFTSAVSGDTTPLLCLLASFGAIYYKITTFECKEAIPMIRKLPNLHFSSDWAQQQLGRAYFEIADYKEAYEVLHNLYKKKPQRTTGLDLYSTTLWHLKKQVELSFLAQKATDLNKLSPEAWCAAGNCFSLHGEHDIALSFFQRAIHLNPAFVYAYTLSGHEYVANEDYEKAANCYRHAIRVDPRHYNAWYGLGTICYRQEKYEFARYHFERALKINPNSSMLHYFVGLVMHSMKKYNEALQKLETAIELQPFNLQARIQRANVLISQEQFDAAMDELLAVRDLAPQESSVYYLMGQVSKKLNHMDEAMQYYTKACFYGPKNEPMIKTAINELRDPQLEHEILSM